MSHYDCACEELRPGCPQCDLEIAQEKRKVQEEIDLVAAAKDFKAAKTDIEILKAARKLQYLFNRRY